MFIHPARRRTGRRNRTDRRADRDQSPQHGRTSAEHPCNRTMPFRFPDLHTRMLRRQARRVFEVLGHPLRHLPFRGRDAETGNNMPHRRCGFPHRGPTRSNRRIAATHSPSRLRGCLYIRTCAGGELPLHPQSVF